MSGWSRREFLRNASLLGGSAALWPHIARGMNAPARARRPTMLVQFCLNGGFDAILATDPKVRKQVSAKVDIPYPETDLKTFGNTSVGPLMRDLEPFIPEMAILNGMVCGTVSHITGKQQVLQMARSYNSAKPTGLTGTIGELCRRDAPLADVRFIQNLPINSLPPAPGRSLTINPASSVKNPAIDRPDPARGEFELLWKLARDEMRSPAILKALDSQLRGCSSDACMPVEATRDLLMRFPRTELEAPIDPKKLNPDDPLGSTLLATTLRDAFSVLSNRLAPAIFIEDLGWDTHNNNLPRQRQKWKTFGLALRYFLSELRRRKTSDGVCLSECVGVVICSELGRFPVMNGDDGKDHFPECPVILIGPGIRPGQYGDTDENMVATPISVQTGRPSSSAKDFVPVIDDVGSTILHWFGVEDPASAGYGGRRLDFLLD